MGEKEEEEEEEEEEETQYSKKEIERTRWSGKAKRDIGVEVKGGSNGCRSMNNSMFTREDDFPRSSSFHFHYSLKNSVEFHNQSGY